jgi:hypothetical protein
MLTENGRAPVFVRESVAWIPRDIYCHCSRPRTTIVGRGGGHSTPTHLAGQGGPGRAELGSHVIL